MPETPRKPRVIFGTNGVCSCQWGFFFFVYYRGGEVLEVPVGRAAPVAGQPPLVPKARMRVCSPCTESAGRTGHDAPTGASTVGVGYTPGRMGLMSSNLIVERGLLSA